MQTANLMKTCMANRGAAHAGTKRRADESSLHDSDRFTKRFNLLSLEPNGNSNYYIPLSKPDPLAKAPANATDATTSLESPATGDDELMQVDETRDRVYIHNLDDELAGIESDEEKLIFLPDIEKRLSRIPQQLLTGRKDDDHEGQELVLYNVPKSLTMDEGHDSVRKAILETRQRARQKAAEEARHHDMNCKYAKSEQNEVIETAHGYSTGYEGADAVEDDPDAMDMD
ncbi:Hypothetical predicted protein [Lecanosticta acicola]|uniref:Uncharacterized protein n=1 Tax=Lecanosticta acicola TaxID=111012 RepID=A0AAI8Z3L5_9PEZI|nr:Hypothetical predicted protein [Lecanosticta acicola]